MVTQSLRWKCVKFADILLNSQPTVSFSNHIKCKISKVILFHKELSDMLGHKILAARFHNIDACNDYMCVVLYKEIWKVWSWRCGLLIHKFRYVFTALLRQVPIHFLRVKHVKAFLYLHMLVRLITYRILSLTEKDLCKRIIFIFKIKVWTQSTVIIAQQAA